MTAKIEQIAESIIDDILDGFSKSCFVKVDNSDEACDALFDGINRLQEKIDSRVDVIRVDCRSFANRNQVIEYVNERTGKYGGFIFSPVNILSCDDEPEPENRYMLLFEHFEYFAPQSDDDWDKRYALRMVCSMVKNDSGNYPVICAVYEESTPLPSEFYSDIFSCYGLNYDLTENNS